MSWYKEYDKREKERMKQRGEEQPKVQERLEKLDELRKLERLTPDEVSKLRKAAKTDEEFKKALAKELEEKRKGIDKVRGELGMKPLKTADERRKEYEKLLEKDILLKEKRDRLLKEKLGVVSVAAPVVPVAPVKDSSITSKVVGTITAALTAKKLLEVQKAQEIVKTLKIFEIIKGTQLAYDGSKIVGQTVLQDITKSNIIVGSILICESCGGLKGYYETLYAAEVLSVDKEKDEYIYTDSTGKKRFKETFKELDTKNKFKLYDPLGKLELEGGAKEDAAMAADEIVSGRKSLANYVPPTKPPSPRRSPRRKSPPTSPPESKDTPGRREDFSDSDSDEETNDEDKEYKARQDKLSKAKNSINSTATFWKSFIPRQVYEGNVFYLQWKGMVAKVKVKLFKIGKKSGDFAKEDILFYARTGRSTYAALVLGSEDDKTLEILPQEGVAFSASKTSLSLAEGTTYFILNTDFDVDSSDPFYEVVEGSVKNTGDSKIGSFKSLITRGASTVKGITKEQYDSFAGGSVSSGAKNKISDADIEIIKKVLEDNLNTANITKSNAYKRELKRLQEKYPDKNIKKEEGRGSTAVNEATLKGLAGLSLMNTDMFFALEKPMCASLDLADQKMHLLGDVSLSCRRHEPAEPDMMSSSDEEDAAGFIDDFKEGMRKNYDKAKKKAKELYKEGKKRIEKKMRKEKLHEPLTSMEIMLEGYDSENELLTKPVERICPTLGLADRKMQELTI